MASKTDALSVIESWPRELPSSVLLDILMGKSDANTRRIHPSIHAMLRSLESAKLNGDTLSWHWLDKFESGLSSCIPAISHELISGSVDALLEVGYKDEFVNALVVLLLCDVLSSSYDPIEDQLSDALSSRTEFAAKAALGGLCGEPDVRSINWLLRVASDFGSKSARTLARSISLASKGDAEAKLAVVALALPFWHLLLQDGRWMTYPDGLGFPSVYAEEFDNEPDFLAFQAAMLYANGKAGDEHKAILLAVTSAIQGAAEGWNLLREWREKGDGPEILGAFLRYGPDIATKKWAPNAFGFGEGFVATQNDQD